MKSLFQRSFQWFHWFPRGLQRSTDGWRVEILEKFFDSKSKLRMELIGCRSILISTRNGPMWRSGSVLRLQFWFACKSKSSTLFLTLPSGSIQECSRFINKSGITMIWSILPHRSFDQSKCMYMHQNRTVRDILRTENFLITLYNKKVSQIFRSNVIWNLLWLLSRKRIYTISEFAPSRVVYYSLSIAICTSSCVSSIERRLDKSKKVYPWSDIWRYARD